MKKFNSTSHIFFILVILIISISFFSCECVPTIDSEKTILPTQFGKVGFINITDELEYINIYQREINVADSINNLQFTKQDISNTRLEKIETGFTNISVFDSKLYKNNHDVFLNSPVLSFISEIELNKYYSAIIYTRNHHTQCFFLEDIISTNSTALRFINLSSDTVCFNIKISNQSENNSVFLVSAFNYNELFLYNSIQSNEILTIDITDSTSNSTQNKIITKINIQLEKNNIYNIFYLQNNNKLKISKSTLE